ncbi:MAG: hypothetical protein M1838_000474 [Thelocarpon superellum]|nr:MAG: hypothetical protein M1838_000474 [Thelocarpon superellum]
MTSQRTRFINTKSGINGTIQPPTINQASTGSESNTTDPADNNDPGASQADRGVISAPLVDFVLLMGDVDETTDDENTPDDAARYQLWYSNKQIQSADGITLYSAPIDAMKLQQSLQTMQAFAQGQPAMTSNHFQVDGGNLTMLLASASTNASTSQNFTWTNVAQLAGVFLQDLQQNSTAINSTYVGVVKDAQTQPLINMAILPLFIENDTPSPFAPPNPNPATPAANTNLTDSPTLTGPSRTLQGVPGSQVRTERIPRTALQLAWAPVALTATKEALNAVARTAADTLTSGAALLVDGYVNKAYFTAPGAGVALHLDVVGADANLKLDMTPVVKAIQHVTWSIARSGPVRAGRVQAFQGMIYQGSTALVNFYFSQGQQALVSSVQYHRDEL